MPVFLLYANYARRLVMEGIKYLYELCEALPRSGPGDNKDTKKAFNSIRRGFKQPFILDMDIGCGQGMQTIELAKISNGKITALDNHLPKLIFLNPKEPCHTSWAGVLLFYRIRSSSPMALRSCLYRCRKHP
jgi:hypothetical protein